MPASLISGVWKLFVSDLSQHTLTFSPQFVLKHGFQHEASWVKTGRKWDANVFQIPVIVNHSFELVSAASNTVQHGLETEGHKFGPNMC